jgi:hypothetical protein
LRRYKLHLASATTQCPNGITDAQSKRIEEELQGKKSRYNDLFLVAVVQPPPRQPQKSSFSSRDASKKETMHKRRHHPIIDHRFSSWRKSSLTKIMPSTRSLADTTN